MKTLIAISRLFSACFRPTYYPAVGLFMLFAFTYLRLLPFLYKVFVLAMVCFFTIAVPSLGVYLYRKSHGWHLYELRHQGKRTVPYAIHFVSYGACVYVMAAMHLPRFLVAVIVVSMLIQASCLIVNIWHKVSMHSAGAGGVAGALVAYSHLFGFNPIWWLCGAILLAGVVMTSRMLLRQHTLGQVMGGTAIGVACGILGVLL